MWKARIILSGTFQGICACTRLHTLSWVGREVPSGDATVESATMVGCEARDIDQVGVVIGEMARGLKPVATDVAVLVFVGVAVDVGGPVGTGVPVVVSVCGMTGVCLIAGVS